MSGFFQNTSKPEGLGGKIMVTSMNIGHASMAAWGLMHIAPGKADSVLDIGCGGGANIKRLLVLCPEGHVTGVDYSPVSVEASRKNNAAAISKGKCAVVQANVSALPFEPEQFDLVTAFETVYFWPDIENAFRQVLRVLKPRGNFFICNEADGLNPANEKWTSKIEGMTIYNAEQLSTLLNNAGFTDIQTDNDAKRHWLCVKAKKRESGNV